MATHLLPCAKNTSTGQRQKSQDLTGARFTLSQRALAQSVAETIAENLTRRTGDHWEPYLAEYTPSVRRSQ